MTLQRLTELGIEILVITSDFEVSPAGTTFAIITVEGLPPMKKCTIYPYDTEMITFPFRRKSQFVVDSQGKLVTDIAYRWTEKTSSPTIDVDCDLMLEGEKILDFDLSIPSTE